MSGGTWGEYRRLILERLDQIKKDLAAQDDRVERRLDRFEARMAKQDAKIEALDKRLLHAETKLVIYASVSVGVATLVVQVLLGLLTGK